MLITSMSLEGSLGVFDGNLEMEVLEYHYHCTDNAIKVSRRRILLQLKRYVYGT